LPFVTKAPEWLVRVHVIHPRPWLLVTGNCPVNLLRMSGFPSTIN
jgi:hypothetical protein